MFISPLSSAPCVVGFSASATAWRPVRLPGRPGRLLLRGAAVQPRQGARDQRDGEQHDRRGERAAQLAVAPHLVGVGALPVQAFRVGVGDGRGEEGLLHGGQDGPPALLPFAGGREPCAAVELVVRAAECVPRVCGHLQVGQDALALDVLVEPRAQSRPGTHQRLVRDGRAVVRGGHQPRADEQVEQPGGLGRAGEHSGRHPGGHRLAGGGRGHQAQQHGAQAVPVPRCQRLVEPLRGLGDRRPDPAGRPVALHREHAALTVLPRLGQRVGEQGQAARGAGDVADQQGDQAGLERQPHEPGRGLDGLAQVVVAERGQQHQAPLGEVGERGALPQPAQVVGAQRRDHRRPTPDEGRESVQERPDGLPGGVVGEQLLELVHHQQAVVAQHGERGGQRGPGLGSRRAHAGRVPGPCHRGHDAGADQGGLPAS